MITVEQLGGRPVWEEYAEAAERKGIGHPDTITDSICEAVSIALSKEYLSSAGRILHYNIDKGLLSAGTARKDFRGGKVLKPMRLYIGDRATFEFMGKKIPVREVAAGAARKWISENLRFVEPERHVRCNVVLAPGSAQLAKIYTNGSGVPAANDTSAATGYWPLSPTEEMVLALEKYLNSKAFKNRFPETGEDVKVMGLREGRQLSLTVAMPLVDRFIRTEAEYFERKQTVLEMMERFVAARNRGAFDDVLLYFNSLDERGKGLAGIYLSVLGTSAEDADSGQAGRGNRVNGLISFCRPQGMEAAAGKNPKSHVGKIYNVLSYKLARRIYEEVEGLSEACVLLVSRIGLPVNSPPLVSARLRLKKGVRIGDVSGPAREIIEEELSAKKISSFTRELARGKYSVC
ncbi:MAG: methionine adenosyltransferase [Nitrospiraceae bacterium]|nr:methionine adenosyltransferase [Nitrospiraceae bacterium]